MVAATLQIFMAASVVLGVRSKGTLYRILYLGAAAATLAGILFSLSRSALAVSCMTLMLVFGYLLLSRKRSRAVELLLMGCFSALILSGVVYLFMTYDFSRFWSTGYYENEAVGGRAAAMRTAALVWRDHPLFGTGPGAVYPRLENEPDWE
ncbi:MAG: O-antigen ligase family protein, partial [Candidatus Hydrogenedentes bacterium]|nr:O-antigen ligase family protein [Candidatus Hydrogenedentota bacterium]